MQILYRDGLGNYPHAGPGRKFPQSAPPSGALDQDRRCVKNNSLDALFKVTVITVPIALILALSFPDFFNGN